MDLGIGGLKVLITAGAGGIGLKTAQTFLREGAKVHVCDVDDESLAQLADTAPGATGTKCDVSNRDQVAALIDTALDDLGGIDCLVNNAGIAGPTGRIDEIAPEDWERCLEVCITGQFNIARIAVPHLKASQRHPSIINYSSAAGRFGFPLRSPYASAKWAVVGFTKTLAMELGPNGIRCNVIQPGPVDGARIRAVIDAKARAANKSFEEMQSDILAHQSIKQLIPPQQLADLTVYLASPLTSLISGQEFAVDGDMQQLA